MYGEEIRQVFAEELEPELREARGSVSNMSRGQKLSEETERIRLDTRLRRLEFTEQSRVLESRIAALEDQKGAVITP
jgi:hypothetical protein